MQTEIVPTWNSNLLSYSDCQKLRYPKKNSVKLATKLKLNGYFWESDLARLASKLPRLFDKRENLAPLYGISYI